MSTGIIRENIDMAVDKLLPYKMNAKMHNKSQISKIVRSLKEFGWVAPVIIDENNMILAGHGRTMAAKECGIEKVPCVRISGLSDMQKKAYVLADNKLSEDADWDFSKLKAELEALADNGYDKELSGFSSDDYGIDFDDLKVFDDDIVEESVNSESRYTRKIDGLKYEANGSPELNALIDECKYVSLIEDIEKSTVSEKEKDFLRHAASRFYKFDYAKIADYYCGASEEMQQLMEKMALVIIDFDKAIENGFVMLSKNLERYRIENES